MALILDLPEKRVMLKTPDEVIQIIPINVFESIISGEKKIIDFTDWEPIARVILKEWLDGLQILKDI